MRANAKTLFVWAVLGAASAACGTDTPAEGVNAPCTRTHDCGGGLQCLGGFCHAVDAGAPLDGGPAADSNAFDAIEPE